jgi:hypothetical protein
MNTTRRDWELYIVKSSNHNSRLIGLASAVLVNVNSAKRARSPDLGRCSYVASNRFRADDVGTAFSCTVHGQAHVNTNPTD